MFAGSGQVEYSGSGTITALNGALTVNIPTSASLVFHLTGTWVATVIFEASVDGTNYFTVPATQVSGGSQVTTATVNGAYLVGVGGYAFARARASAFTSGTITVSYSADNTPNIQATVQQGNAPWSVTGTITAAPADGLRVTYSAAVVNASIALLATDIFTITGSASKTIRVTNIGITTTGGGVVSNVILLKRSTANSGGTSTTLTNVPHDSADTAATATVRSYTANPTTGTLVGNIRSIKINSPLVSAITAPSDPEWLFGTRGKAIVLRGTGEVLSINLAGVTISGAAFSIYVEWTEES